MSKIKKKRWLSAFLFGIAASLFLVSGLYGIPAQAKQTDKSVTDALSVAKYYRLKSTTLGIDYSGAVYEKVSAPAGGKAFPDQTPPVILSANARRIGDSVQIGISAQDAESGVRYFSYSVNGGVTRSPLQRWAAGGPNASYTVPVPAGTDSVMVRVQNAYDLTADTVVQAG